MKLIKTLFLKAPYPISFNLLFLFLLVSESFQLEAKTDFSAGYIITTSNQRIDGFIENQNFGINPVQIRFKPSLTGHIQSYRPGNLKEFATQGFRFISFWADLETTPTRTNDLEDDKNLNIVQDSIFLKIVYTGSKTLYHYRSASGRDNFYVNEKGDLQLLIFKKYIQYKSKAYTVAYNNTYQGQLSLYLLDCQDINDKIKVTSYNLKSMTNLFKAYFQCKNETPSFEYVQSGIRSTLGVFGGYSSSQLDFEGDAPVADYLIQPDFGTSHNFTFGLSLDLAPPRKDALWSIFNELQYYSYQFQGFYLDVNNADNYKEITTDLQYTYLKLNNMVRIRIPFNHIKPYINAGISHGYAIQENNTKTSVHTKSNQTSTEIGVAVSDSRRLEQAYLLGFGVQYNKVACEFRYVRGNGMARYLHISSSTESLHVMISYFF